MLVFALNLKAPAPARAPLKVYVPPEFDLASKGVFIVSKEPSENCITLLLPFVWFINVFLKPEAIELLIVTLPLKFNMASLFDAFSIPVPGFAFTSIVKIPSPEIFTVPPGVEPAVAKVV